MLCSSLLLWQIRLLFQDLTIIYIITLYRSKIKRHTNHSLAMLNFYFNSGLYGWFGYCAVSTVGINCAGTVMAFWSTIIVSRGLSHPTQKVWIQTKKGPNCQWYLQRTGWATLPSNNISVPEFIDPVLGMKTLVFAKTCAKRSFSIQSWDTWCMVSRTPGRGVVDTYVLCCGLPSSCLYQCCSSLIWLSTCVMLAVLLALCIACR